MLLQIITNKTSKRAIPSINKAPTWAAMNPSLWLECNYKTALIRGLDIAKSHRQIMRERMASTDKDPAQNYTQSLGCWHGFYRGQQEK